jgi:hypothetical protein
MNRFKQATLLALALVVLSGLVGCGSGVYPVKGTVLFNGKPMAGGGAISFIPLNDQAGNAPGGEIAEDGTFSVSTAQLGNGAAPGEYRVAIHQVTVREPERTEDGERPASIEAIVPVSQRIPPIYADHQNSPLRATVEAKSLNEIRLELKR